MIMYSLNLRTLKQNVLIKVRKGIGKLIPLFIHKIYDCLQYGGKQMYRECSANLAMKRVILGEGYYDEGKYECTVIRDIPEKESIYLLTGETDLPVFSLDALYECSIYTGEESISCQGYIRERYMSKIGRVVLFQIENGFYKNPVN